MQKILTTSVICCIMVLVFSTPASSKPMTDDQLEKLLADKNMMMRHLKCAVGEGPCDAVGRRLRTLAPLVLQGTCRQCTPQEVHQIRRTLAHIQRNYPWQWSKLIRQYG